MDADALRAALSKAQDHVRILKKENAAKEVVMAAVAEMKELRAQLEAVATEDDSNKLNVDRAALEVVMKHRMIVVPAFEIYDGVAGLYDFGPIGCALKQNMLDLWRKHFILEENMLQVECTTLTPFKVLDVSGHVAMFSDFMVKDVKTGECYRADKLLEAQVEALTKDVTMPSARREELRRIAAQADAFSQEELGAQLVALGVRAPATDNELTAPFPFNLMFQTSIGPSGNLPGFMRPETAQGIFVNFRRLLEFNGGKMPFAAAQIGSAYRNEISPRSGLLRVREFQMAEIEHFVHPEDKRHAKFANVKDLNMVLFPAANQTGDGRMVTVTAGQAVADGTIANETLAYYMARTQQFLHRIGIRPEGLRFRQHLASEKAHYANDCWDAEILMSYGWIECVGHADRACYDLRAHQEASKVSMLASRVLDAPRTVTRFRPIFDRKTLGLAFTAAARTVSEEIEKLCEADAIGEFKAKLEADGSAELTVSSGEKFTVQAAMVTFKSFTKTEVEEKYLPGVIEPSFGIGRILYGLLEHSFWCREGDAQRAVFRFRPVVAPTKCSVLPVDGRISAARIAPLSKALTAAGVSHVVDQSGTSIGKRYARTDEVGVPFAITVDHELDGRVTLRERDTCAQIRVSEAEVAQLVADLCDERVAWADLMLRYQVVTTGEDKAPTAGAAAGSAAGAAAGSAAAGSAAGRPSFIGTQSDGHFSRPLLAIPPVNPALYVPEAAEAPKPKPAAPPAAPAAAKKAAAPAVGGELGALDATLLTQPYVGGFVPSRADAAQFQKLQGTTIPEGLYNVTRWLAHMKSYAESERASWQ